ncbi:MAG: hypothetical protein J6T61_00495 [Spirochaetia bacterium]|nr:hypothetical protein [Spirochaetia bacterium]
MRNFGFTIKIMAAAATMSALFCSCNVSGGSSFAPSVPEETAATSFKSSGIGSIVIDNIKVKTVSENDMLTVEFGKVGNYSPVDSLELTGTKADSFTHFSAEFSDVDAGTYWVKCIYTDGRKEAAISATTVEVKGSETTYVSDISLEPGVFQTGSPFVISGPRYFGITIGTEGNITKIDRNQELRISCSANEGSEEIGYCAWYINGKKVATGKDFIFCRSVSGTYTVVCIATDNADRPLYSDRDQIVISVR